MNLKKLIENMKTKLQFLQKDLDKIEKISKENTPLNNKAKNGARKPPL